MSAPCWSMMSRKPHRVDFGLAGCYSHVEVVRKPGRAFHVVWRRRLFQPDHTEILKHASRNGRQLGVVIAVISVHHEVHAVAQRCLGRPDASGVFLDRAPPHTHLNRFEAALGAARQLPCDVVRGLLIVVIGGADVGWHLPVGAAEQPPERQVSKSRLDVPERDVNRAHRPHHRAAAPDVDGSVEHALPQGFDAQRVTAYDKRRQCGDCMMHQVAASGVAEAFDPAVCDDADEIVFPIVKRHSGNGRRTLQRNAERGRLDGRNAHGGPDSADIATLQSKLI